MTQSSPSAICSKLGPPTLVGALRRLATAFGCVAFGERDRGVADDGDGVVELLALGTVAVEPALHALDLVLRLLPDGGEALADGLVVVGAEVAHGSGAGVFVAEGHYAVAHDVVELGRQGVVREAAEVVLRPEVLELHDIVHVFLVHVVGVEGTVQEFAAPDLVEQPADGVFGEEGRAVVGGGQFADYDLVLVHDHGHLLAQIGKVLRPLDHGWQSGVVLIELGDQPEALDADLGLGVAISLADPRYPRCDRRKLVHATAPF